MRCPCKECFERAIACHGFCKEYTEWRKWRDEINRKRAADHEVRTMSRDHGIKYRKNLKLGKKRGA